MTGEEMLEEIDRREYYDQKEHEHIELVELWWLMVKIGVITCGLLSIVGHVAELWNSLAGSF